MVDWNREAAETDRLLSELQRRGIDAPKGPEFWFDDLEQQSGTFEEIELKYRHYLTPEGKARANALIRKDKRQNAEWWVRMLTTIGALLTGLLGAFIGVLAFLKK
jgi:hypothetical protein